MGPACGGRVRLTMLWRSGRSDQRPYHQLEKVVMLSPILSKAERVGSAFLSQQLICHLDGNGGISPATCGHLRFRIKFGTMCQSRKHLRSAPISLPTALPAGLIAFTICADRCPNGDVAHRFSNGGVDGSRWAPRTSNLLFRQLPVGRRVRLPCTPASSSRSIRLILENSGFG